LVIRERRREQRLDQRSLANKVGVSRQWVIAAEKGNPGAELGLVLKTLEALGVRLSVESKELVRGRSAASGLPPIDIDAVVDRARGKKR
jgi:HTH-type transcriptional regulator/antitoxin HipB